MESRNEESKSNKEIMHFMLLTSINFLLHYSSTRKNKDDIKVEEFTKTFRGKWKRE